MGESIMSRNWNEQHQSELPAMEVLSRLGWREARAEELDAETLERLFVAYGSQRKTEVLR